MAEQVPVPLIKCSDKTAAWMKLPDGSYMLISDRHAEFSCLKICVPEEAKLPQKMTVHIHYKRVNDEDVVYPVPRVIKQLDIIHQGSSCCSVNVGDWVVEEKKEGDK